MTSYGKSSVLGWALSLCALSIPCPRLTVFITLPPGGHIPIDWEHLWREPVLFISYPQALYRAWSIVDTQWVSVEWIMQTDTLNMTRAMHYTFWTSVSLQLVPTITKLESYKLCHCFSCFFAQLGLTLNSFTWVVSLDVTNVIRTGTESRMSELLRELREHVPQT